MLVSSPGYDTQGLEKKWSSPKLIYIKYVYICVTWTFIHSQTKVFCKIPVQDTTSCSSVFTKGLKYVQLPLRGRIHVTAHIT